MSPAHTLTHICVFESSNVIGAIPTHQRDVAQALQSSDHKLLHTGGHSESWHLHVLMCCSLGWVMSLGQVLVFCSNGIPSARL